MAQQEAILELRAALNRRLLSAQAAEVLVIMLVGLERLLIIVVLDVLDHAKLLALLPVAQLVPENAQVIALDLVQDALVAVLIVVQDVMDAPAADLGARVAAIMDVKKLAMVVGLDVLVVLGVDLAVEAVVEELALVVGEFVRQDVLDVLDVGLDVGLDAIADVQADVKTLVLMVVLIVQQHKEKIMNSLIITIPEEICNELQKLYLEVESRQSLLAFMINQNMMNNSQFQEYESIYKDYYYKYVQLKNKFQQQYINNILTEKNIKPEKAFWHIDFEEQNCILTFSGD